MPRNIVSLFKRFGRQCSKTAQVLAANRYGQGMEKYNDIKMDTRDNFKQVIFNHYKNISADEVPVTLLNSLCDKITDYYYDQYTRFRKQYPKSIKRYSTFQLKDIDHPQTNKIVVDFFKNELKTQYRSYSKLLLSMTDTELDKFEQWWYDFERL